MKCVEIGCQMLCMLKIGGKYAKNLNIKEEKFTGNLSLTLIRASIFDGLKDTLQGFLSLNGYPQQFSTYF